MKGAGRYIDQPTPAGLRAARKVNAARTPAGATQGRAVDRRCARDLTAPAGESAASPSESRALAGNRWATRRRASFISAGWRGRPLPLLVGLVGFTGSGQSHTNSAGLHRERAGRLDRLIHEGGWGRSPSPFPDCYTRLGGNQLHQQRGHRRYADYLIDEVVPVVEAPGAVRQPAGAAAASRRASYGAIVHPAAALRISGRLPPAIRDMAFDICYLYDMP